MRGQQQQHITPRNTSNRNTRLSALSIAISNDRPFTLLRSSTHSKSITKLERSTGTSSDETRQSQPLINPPRLHPSNPQKWLAAVSLVAATPSLVIAGQPHSSTYGALSCTAPRGPFSESTRPLSRSNNNSVSACHGKYHSDQIPDYTLTSCRLFPYGVTVGVLTIIFLWVIEVMLYQRNLLPGVVMLGAFILFVLYLTGLIECAIQLFGSVRTFCPPL